MFEKVPRKTTAIKAIDDSMFIEWARPHLGFGNMRLHFCPITGKLLIDNEQISRERVAEILMSLANDAVLTDNQEIKFIRQRIDVATADGIYKYVTSRYPDDVVYTLDSIKETRDGKYHDLLFIVKPADIKESLPGFYDDKHEGYHLTLRCEKIKDKDGNEIDIKKYMSILNISMQMKEINSITALPVKRAIVMAYWVTDNQLS